MSLINKITNIFSRKTSTVTLLNGYNEAFNEDSSRIISNDAYRLSIYVNIAIDKLITNATRAPFRIYDGDNLIESGPVWDLFNDVNPHMFGFQLWKATIAWRKLKGEAIWTFEPGFTGLSMPKEIYVHNPSNFESVYNREINRIVLWKYHEPGGAIIPLLPAEVIQFRVWNPWDEYRGVNPLLPFEDLLQQDYLSDKNNLFLLRNKSTPSGLLSTEETMTEDKAKEYIERWEQKHSGVSRSGRIAILGNGLKYQQIGLSPADMEYLSQKKWNRATIMSKFGIPPVVSGYKDDTSPLSGTDTGEQLIQFWNQTLLPELNEIESVLASEFSTRWAPRLHFDFDTSEINELQDDQEKLSNRYINEVKSGILTINEVREYKGLDPVPWGDTWWTGTVNDIQLQTEYIGQLDEPKEEEDEDEDKSMTLFDKPPIEQYSEVQKIAAYEKAIAAIEPLEEKIHDDISEWLYKTRSRMLEQAAKVDTVPDYLGPKFWKSAKESLTDKLTPDVKELIEAAGKSTGLPPAPISDRFLKSVIDKFITVADFFQPLSRETTAAEIKRMMRDAEDELNIFCRAGVGRILNEVRMKTYLFNGYEKHQYFTRAGGSVFNQGAIVKLYDPFPDCGPVPTTPGSIAISLPIGASRED
jgi:HK97 family phage portal protein